MTEPGSPVPSDPSTLGYQRIRYERNTDAGVATVTIARPEVLNALDLPTLKEMSDAFEQASWDDSVAVVVVTGEGDRAFCTGADLDEQALMGATSGQYWRWMGAFIEMHDRLRHIGKPTIARINGVCVGGGQELQLACDLSVMVDDAYIRHVGPEHGSVPAGGATQWLPLVVGDRRAREIVMLCEQISPAQALEWGLVSRVASRAELDAVVGELAAKLARKLPEALRYTKTQLNWWRDLVWSQTIEHARDWLAVHSTSDETKEAVRAFHEKRPPRYEALRRLESGAGQVCPNCGEQGLPATHRFCGLCGTGLPDRWEAVP
ncbi:MAG TPA: enoyl-CoA hydratase-related protein [Candidatus Limnocylindria bacterium]|nr:enoyl-CoA hydratase-related protein [Candidatus Limnocylindria bacterium]